MRDLAVMPSKRDELIYHGRNALELPLEQGLAIIEDIEDGPAARRFAVELRLMCEAMDIRRADTPQAIAERDETKRKLTIWSLSLDARIAEVYDALPDASGNQYSASLPAGNEASDKEQFIEDVGVQRKTIGDYRKLIARKEAGYVDGFVGVDAFISSLDHKRLRVFIEWLWLYNNIYAADAVDSHHFLGRYKQDPFKGIDNPPGYIRAQTNEGAYPYVHEVHKKELEKEIQDAAKLAPAAVS